MPCLRNLLLITGNRQETMATDIRVQPVLDFITQQLARGLTVSEQVLAVSELAYLVDLSDSRLRHVFTAQTGMPPSEWLREFRFARAKQLLKEKQVSIDQIALMVGYHSRSHFERRFKKLYGMTPAQYRKSLRPNVLINKLKAAHNAASITR